MTKDLPEAPWRFIYEVLVLDGKRYKVFKLGADGKKMLENAMCKTQCWQARDQFEKDIKELKSMLNVLTDIIGPCSLVEYLRKHILVQLKDRSCRTGDLIFPPYGFEKQIALQELLKEDKVVHTRNGWWKLGRI